MLRPMYLLLASSLSSGIPDFLAWYHALSRHLMLQRCLIPNAYPAVTRDQKLRI